MKASSGWAREVIDAGRAAGAVPKYASEQWLELEPTDPRRLAALVIAAECWWWDGLDEVMAERLADELYEADLLVATRVRSTSYDVAGATDWRTVAGRRWPERRSA